MGLTLDRRQDALGDGHIGLASIEDRVEAVGGSFSVENRSGGGTSCRVVLPLNEQGPGRTYSREPPTESLEDPARVGASVRIHPAADLTRVGED